MAKLDLVAAACFAVGYGVLVWNDWLSVSGTKSMSGELSLRVILKTLPVVGLMRAGFSLAWSLQGLKEARYGRAVLLGLFASMVGDVLVELSWVRGRLFALGAAAYLCAHVCYAVAMLLRRSSGRRAWGLLCAVLWLAAAASGYHYLNSRVADAHYALAALAAAVFAVGWSASTRLGCGDSAPASQRWALAGAVLLSIADVVQAACLSGAQSSTAALVGGAAVRFAATACLTLSIEGGLRPAHSAHAE